MRTIHKHVIDKPVVEIPTFERARFLHADEQHGEITVWVEVNTLERECLRRVLVVPTGGQVPAHSDFVGTVLLGGGQLVFHVYVTQAL